MSRSELSPDNQADVKRIKGDIDNLQYSAECLKMLATEEEAETRSVARFRLQAIVSSIEKISEACARISVRLLEEEHPQIKENHAEAKSESHRVTEEERSEADSTSWRPTPRRMGRLPKRRPAV